MSQHNILKCIKISESPISRELCSNAYKWAIVTRMFTCLPASVTRSASTFHVSPTRSLSVPLPPGLTYNVACRVNLLSFVPSTLTLQVMKLPSLIRSLSLIDDRRSDKDKHYPLPLLLLIAFCTSISKQDSWYTMQDYAQAHEASLKELYKQLFGEELELVTPTHDTLNRALQVIPISSSSDPIGIGSPPYFWGRKRRD